jgi:hypothetical protein
MKAKLKWEVTEQDFSQLSMPDTDECSFSPILTALLN